MIEPYLNLKGQAKKAIEHYQDTFDATDIHITYMGDFPGDPQNPLPAGMEKMVAQSSLVIFGSTVHISDMAISDQGSEGKISLLIHLESPLQLEAVYNKLMSAGGHAVVQLCEQPFARRYAWVTDQFGIGWQLMYV